MSNTTDNVLEAAGEGMNATQAAPATANRTELDREELQDGETAEARGDLTPPTDVSDEALDSHNEKAQRPDLTRQESQADKFSKAQIAIIIFSLCMALFLAALDITIIATALPTIAAHFHASAADYTWVGSSYLLACAAAVPLWGKISDIWGRKPIVMMANVVFMIGSLISALANSIGMLIGGRVVQGIGGGGLVILVNICVADLFSMRERPKWYGVMGGVWAVASGVGPLIGGAFTEKVSWRWCFYINLPLDGLSLILLFFFLKLDTPKTPLVAGLKAIDWFGVLTVVGGVTMFLFGMESGGLTHPWDSAFVLCLIIFGIITVGIFFINEWRFAKYPVIPLRVFSNVNNMAALGVCFCHGMVFIAESYYLPLYFQTVLGASPILSGVYLLALVLALSFGSVFNGVFIKKTGLYRPPIYFGLIMMTLGTGLLIDLKPYASWPRIIIFQIITGLGVGPNFQAPLIALQSHTKGHDIAVATATFGFIRNIATAMSVVIGGVIFQNVLATHESSLAATLGPNLAYTFSASSFGSTTGLLATLPPNQKAAIDEAYTSSLQKIWIFYTVISALGFGISLFIKKKELSKEHEKVVTGVEEQERVRKLELEERKARKAGHHGGKDVEAGGH